MKLQLFAIRDVKVDGYGRPFFSQSVGTASREFQQAVTSKEEGNQFNRYPEDFALFHCGEFDQESGEMTGTPNGKPIFIVEARAFIQ